MAAAFFIKRYLAFLHECSIILQVKGWMLEILQVTCSDIFWTGKSMEAYKCTCWNAR